MDAASALCGSAGVRPDNFLIIQPNAEDPSLSKKLTATLQQARNNLVPHFPLKNSLVALGVVAGSLMSYVMLFHYEPAQALATLESKENSQTLALLAPAGSPVPPQGGPDLMITEDAAVVPMSSPSDEMIPSVNTGSGQISVYVVREGDTLSQIAEMFDVSVNTIIWANDLEGASAKPGQTLVILPMSGVRHVVKSGDTLASLAKKYNAEEGEIRRFNNLSRKDELSVGQILDIPGGEIVVEKKVATTKSTKTSAGSTSSAGWLIKPVQGAVRTQGIHGYNGVDLAAPIGTNILAAAGGQVIIAANGWNGGYGNYIVLKHPNGTQTVYGHLSGILVSPGQSVAQGQVIGFLGNTGRSTGPHLHFEVRGATNPF